MRAMLNCALACLMFLKFGFNSVSGKTELGLTEAFVDLYEIIARELHESMSQAWVEHGSGRVPWLQVTWDQLDPGYRDFMRRGVERCISDGVIIPGPTFGNGGVGG